MKNFFYKYLRVDSNPTLNLIVWVIVLLFFAYTQVIKYI